MIVFSQLKLDIPYLGMFFYLSKCLFLLESEPLHIKNAKLKKPHNPATIKKMSKLSSLFFSWFNFKKIQDKYLIF